MKKSFEFPNYGVKIEKTSPMKGRLSFTHHSRTEPVFLECSLSVIERVINGDFPAKRGVRRLIHERHKENIGKGRIVNNLAYEFMMEYPVYFEDDDLRNGFKPIDLSELKLTYIDGHMPFLPKEEDVPLFKSFNYHKRSIHNLAQAILDSDSKENIVKIVEARQSASQFFDLLFRMTDGFVPYMLGETRANIFDQDDFISEAYLALGSAIVYFDFTRKKNFSAYACGAIRKRYNNFMSEMRKNRHLQLTGDFHGIEFATKTETVGEIEDQVDSLKEVLDGNILNEREKDIIYRRYGFFGRETALAEIGRTYEIVRERARQIEGRALDKLREELISYSTHHV